ncbi:MAG: hypothetical protein ACRCXA_07805 [Peptostreptococcaceae bacterium]
MKISSNGSASITASVTGVPGVNKSTITSSLQQYKNNKWTTIAIFSESGTRICNLSKSKTVTKGYKYRVSSVVKVFKGNVSEQKTVNSSSVNY